SPRCGSPRSGSSTLITSAPQSASTAPAAGTKSQLATSRTFTPSSTPAMTTRLPCLLGRLLVDVDDDLAKDAAVGHGAQRRGRGGQRKAGADIRPQPAGGQVRGELAPAGRGTVGKPLKERAHLEARDRDLLQQDQVQRDPRDDAGGVADGDEP